MESVVELLVLRCYGFTKSWIRLASLSQLDVKGDCPAMLPGRPQTSKLKSEDEESDSKAALFILSGTSLDTPPAAIPIRLFLWGGAPPRTAFLAMPTSSDI